MGRPAPESAVLVTRPERAPVRLAVLVSSLALLPAALLGAQEEPAPAPPAAAPPVYPFRTFLEWKYVGRWTEGARDHDLIGIGDVWFGDPEVHLVTGHFSGRGALDLDRDRSPGQPFRSVDDTYGKDLSGRLFCAYLDLNGVEGNPFQGALRRLRLGRQILDDTPVPLFLDGASLESEPLPSLADLTLFAWGGVPNHLFESSPEGDGAAGAALWASPWAAGRIRLDYMHLEDRYLGAGQADDLLGLDVRQMLWKRLLLQGSLDFLEADARDLRLHAGWADPDRDLNLSVRYSALLSDQTRRGLDLDYYTPFLATYHAYHQVDLFAHAGIGERFLLDGGAQVRQLDEGSDAGVFNHEFRRMYLSPGTVDWPFEGTSLSLTLERWDARGDCFTALGADLTQDLSEGCTASVGSAYHLYRYDVLLDQEREDVRLYYGRLKLRLWEGIDLDARFECEEGDSADYVKVVLGMRIRI